MILNNMKMGKLKNQLLFSLIVFVFLIGIFGVMIVSGQASTPGMGAAYAPTTPTPVPATTIDIDYTKNNAVDWDHFEQVYLNTGASGEQELRKVLQYYNGELQSSGEVYTRTYIYDPKKVEDLSKQLVKSNYPPGSLNLLFDNLRGELQIDVLSYMAKNDPAKFQEVLTSLKSSFRTSEDGKPVALDRAGEILAKSLSGYMFDKDMPLSSDSRLKSQADYLAKEILSQYVKDVIELGKLPPPSGLFGPNPADKYKTSQEKFQNLLKYLGDGADSAKFNGARESFFKIVGKINGEDKTKYSGLWKGIDREGKASFEKIVTGNLKDFEKKDVDVQKVVKSTITGYMDFVSSTKGRGADGMLRNPDGKSLGKIEIKKIDGFQFIKEMRDGKFILINGKEVIAGEVPVTASEMTFLDKGVSYRRTDGGILDDFSKNGFIDHYSRFFIKGASGKMIQLGSASADSMKGSIAFEDSGEGTVVKQFNSERVNGFQENKDGTKGNWDTYFLGNDNNYYFVAHGAKNSEIQFDASGKITSGTDIGVLSMSKGYYEDFNKYYDTADKQRTAVMASTASAAAASSASRNSDMTSSFKAMDKGTSVLYTTGKKVDSSKIEVREVSLTKGDVDTTSTSKTVSVTVSDANDISIRQVEGVNVESLDVKNSENVIYYGNNVPAVRVDGKDGSTPIVGADGQAQSGNVQQGKLESGMSYTIINPKVQEAGAALVPPPTEINTGATQTPSASTTLPLPPPTDPSKQTQVQGSVTVPPVTKSSSTTPSTGTGQPMILTPPIGNSWEIKPPTASGSTCPPGGCGTCPGGKCK